MEPKTMRLPCPLTDDEVQARATEAAELAILRLAGLSIATTRSAEVMR